MGGNWEKSQMIGARAFSYLYGLAFDEKLPDMLHVFALLFH